MRGQPFTSLSVLLFVSILFAAHVNGSWSTAARQVARDRPATKREPLRFTSFAELTPKTPDERTIAQALDRGGEPLEGLGEVGLMVPVESTPQPPPPPSARGERDPDFVLRTAVCRADAIYIGRVQEERVILSKRGTWLLTIYSADVLKKVIGSVPVTESGRAEVAVQSGVVEVAGRTVSTIHIPLLDAKRDYLFFVSDVPRSSVQASWSATSEVSWPPNEGLERRLDKITALSQECVGR